MSEPELRPGAVEAAVAYLHEHGQRYTRASLDASLREQGFTDPEVAEAWLRHLAAQPADLRWRAGAIVILAFLGTWAVLAYLLMRPESSSAGLGVIAAFILAVVLAVVAGVSLLGIGASGRLERGARSALVVALATPFVLLVIVAGLCVSSTGLRI